MARSRNLLMTALIGSALVLPASVPATAHAAARPCSGRPYEVTDKLKNIVIARKGGVHLPTKQHKAARLTARKAVTVVTPDYAYWKAVGKATTRLLATKHTICLFTDANGAAYKRVSVATFRTTLNREPGGLLLALVLSHGKITKVYQVFRS